jgi:hypothetical protein
MITIVEYGTTKPMFVCPFWAPFIALCGPTAHPFGGLLAHLVTRPSLDHLLEEILRLNWRMTLMILLSVRE